MRKLLIMALGLAVCCTIQAADRSEKTNEGISRPVYVSVGGGLAFGDCTFRSISDRGTALGGDGYISAGYKFSKFFSMEVNVTVGKANTKAMSCCDYRLSLDGKRLTAAKPAEDSWNYYDLKSSTMFRKYMLQLNLNLLSFIDKCPLSFDIAPRFGLVSTTTTHNGPLVSTGAMTSKKYDKQSHFAAGGAGILEYAINDIVGIRAYGAIDCLLGERFDNIPEYVHNENFIFDCGLGFVLSF